MRCVCVGRRRFDGCLRWWLVLSVGLCAYGCLRCGLGVRASTGLRVLFLCHRRPGCVRVVVLLDLPCPRLCHCPQLPGDPVQGTPGDLVLEGLVECVLLLLAA